MSETRPTPRTAALADSFRKDPLRYNVSILWEHAEQLESESDARAERIAELERENTAFRDYAPQRLPELILKLQRADELESENAKLREALDEANKDVDRISLLENSAMRGLKWIARWSTTGRGFRLHQDPNGRHETAREALDAMALAGKEEA